MKKNEPELILKVGAAGGSISLWSINSKDGARTFVVTTDESSLKELMTEEDVAGINFESRTALLPSFANALAALGKYPWHRLLPMFVHKDFMDPILTEVMKLGGANEVSRWRRKLEFIRRATRYDQKSAIDIERLEKAAIKTFKMHWKKIVGIIERGRVTTKDICKLYNIKMDKDEVATPIWPEPAELPGTLANKVHRCFEADTTARQKILAKRFYGIDHARKMATLNDREIKENLSCYLQRAAQYALAEYEDEPGEQEECMKNLVRSEYVIFNSSQCCPVEFYDENTDDLWVAGYPAPALYDDWYERIGGFNECVTIVFMKSTGEDFSNTEVNWLRRSIQQNIDHSEPEALWWFECEPLAKNKLWIRIYRFESHKEAYQDGFLEEMEGLPKAQLKEFVRQIAEYEYPHSGKSFKKKLRTFDNFKAMKKKDLFGITEAFFSDNWEALDNMDIRIIEDAMNSITGRKDRDYHARIYY